MAGILMTPRIDAKIRGKMSTHRFKTKSPHFKDILRQRFKLKIKANRRALFDKIRSPTSNQDVIQDTLCDYLHMEIDNIDDSSICSDDFNANLDIEKELEILKQIEQELLDEHLCWLLEEYKKCEEEEVCELMDTSVTCPLCRRGVLKKWPVLGFSCPVCDMKMDSMELEKFDEQLQKKILDHCVHCSGEPEFGVCKDSAAKGMYMLCNECSIFDMFC